MTGPFDDYDPEYHHVTSNPVDGVPAFISRRPPLVPPVHAYGGSADTGGPMGGRGASAVDGAALTRMMASLPLPEVLYRVRIFVESLPEDRLDPSDLELCGRALSRLAWKVTPPC